MCAIGKKTIDGAGTINKYAYDQFDLVNIDHSYLTHYEICLVTYQ